MDRNISRVSKKFSVIRILQKIVSIQLSQITLFPVHIFSHIIPNIRQTQQRHYKKSTRNKNDPPGIGHQCFFRKRQHAPPGYDLNGKSNSHKAQGGFRNNSTSYIHNNHKHNGRYKIGCKMLPENVKEASAHAPGRNNIFTVSDLPDLCTNYLAMLVQLVMPITTDRLKILAFPIIACRRITRSRDGILRKISVKRMIRLSSH